MVWVAQVAWDFESLDYKTNNTLSDSAMPNNNGQPRWSTHTDMWLCCRIWSWSPVPCEKHDPRDSVDKKRGRRLRFLLLLRPEGHVFHMAQETMIKSYYSTLYDWFFPRFIHINMNFSALKWAIFGSLHGCKGNRTVAMDWLPSAFSYDKNLGLRPRFLSTESLGPCFSHSTGDHDQILQ